MERQSRGAPRPAGSLQMPGNDEYLAQAFGDNVSRFTPVRVESAADTARWHGVNERVLVAEHARSIRFFHHLLTNAQGL